MKKYLRRCFENIKTHQNICVDINQSLKLQSSQGVPSVVQLNFHLQKYGMIDLHRGITFIGRMIRIVGSTKNNEKCDEFLSSEEDLNARPPAYEVIFSWSKNYIVGAKFVTSASHRSVPHHGEIFPKLHVASSKFAAEKVGAFRSCYHRCRNELG